MRQVHETSCDKFVPEQVASWQLSEEMSPQNEIQNKTLPNALWSELLPHVAPELSQYLDASSLAALMQSCSAGRAVLRTYTTSTSLSEGLDKLHGQDYPELQALRVTAGTVRVSKQHENRWAGAFPYLKTVVISGSFLETEAVQQLGLLPHLETLRISDAEISAEGYECMENGEFSKIKELQLQKIKLRVPLLQRLVRAPWLQHVTKLDVSHNVFQADQCYVLGGTSLPALQTLIMDFSQLHLQAMQGLALGSWWQNLQTFSARSCHIKADGMKVLRAVASPVLVSLDLSWNSIDADCMSAFGHWSRLECLTLESCGLRDTWFSRTMQVLTTALSFGQVEILSLNYNLLSHAAMEQLVYLWSIPLRELHLRAVCQTGDMLKHLVKALMSFEDVSLVPGVKETLEFLDMSGHGSDLAAGYCKALPEAQLQEVKHFFSSHVGHVKFDSMVGSTLEKYTNHHIEKLFRRHSDARLKLTD